MPRALIVIQGDTDRQLASKWALEAKPFTRIEFKAPRRTLPQNDKMWAMLTDIAMQLRWHGMRLTTDDWKLIFLDGLKRELRLVPNFNGDGFINLGRSSSDLDTEEMGGMFELMYEYGARHGVNWTEPKGE
jgi:hypothetical protein